MASTREFAAHNKNQQKNEFFYIVPWIFILQTSAAAHPYPVKIQNKFFIYFFAWINDANYIYLNKICPSDLQMEQQNNYYK